LEQGHVDAHLFLGLVVTASLDKELLHLAPPKAVLFWGTTLELWNLVGHLVSFLESGFPVDFGIQGHCFALIIRWVLLLGALAFDLGLSIASKGIAGIQSRLVSFQCSSRSWALCLKEEKTCAIVGPLTL
jgi:hypothetical protein